MPGDVDGDGRVDVLIGRAWEASVIYLYGARADGSFVELADFDVNQPRPWAYSQPASPVGDINGDGYADVALLASVCDGCSDARSSVLVFFGPLSGSYTADDADLVVEGMAAVEAHGDFPTAIGRHVIDMAPGDFDDDGVMDLLVAQRTHLFTLARPEFSWSPTDRQTAWIVRGPFAAGRRWTGDAEVALVVDAEDQFEVRDVAACRLDDEGHTPVFVGWLDGWCAEVNRSPDNAIMSRMELRIGRLDPDGIETRTDARGTPAADLEKRLVVELDPCNPRKHVNLLCGDLDGDELDEIVLAHWSAGESDGRVYVFSSRAPQADPVVLEGGPHARFGRAVTIIEDLDNDGFRELAVSATSSPSAGIWASERNPHVRIYHGGETIGPDEDAVIVSEKPSTSFGTSLASGDVTGDGVPDLVIGAPDWNGDDDTAPEGRVVVFSGAELREPR